MIPARLGSQRLKRKNLELLRGTPLIVHAIRKAKIANVFDEIWVNSESDIIGEKAIEEGVGYHKRPSELANNSATSEDFVYEFLKKHNCDYLVQLHSIAPLLSIKDIRGFVKEISSGKKDVLLSAEQIQIECAFQNKPINFSFENKTNSQDLQPVQKISWSITGWRSDSYIKAYEKNQCATYNNSVGFFPINKLASHVIKTKEDMNLAEALLPLIEAK